ncbi:hypothetical protein GpartN1_g78.t1 [Galdieria partita]|uniref:Signal sequence receptor subunit gamma n=1 Tax=Galdieria partita TaxID=83374 RepID=A0A9C7UM75_9RHOD|nr:hypothetical protein GpartN1_g78.t1 [Galdieria partita]
MSSTEAIENLLLKTFPKEIPISYYLLYMLLATPVLALDVYLYLAVFHLNPMSSSVSFIVGTVIAVILMTVSYHKTAYAKWSKLDRSTEPPTKSSFKGKSSAYQSAVENRLRLMEKTAVSYSVMVNNAIFQAFIVVIGFYLLKDKVPDELNFVVAVTLSAVFVRLNSETAFKSVHS